MMIQFEGEPRENIPYATYEDYNGEIYLTEEEEKAHREKVREIMEANGTPILDLEIFRKETK